MWGSSTSTDADNRTIEGWLRQWTLGETFAGLKYAKERNSCRIEVGTRELFSYGRHFRLAAVHANAGRRRGGIILLNGDRWGGSNSRTSSHQSNAQTIAATICREAPEWQCLILPDSAIGGAGIDASSIRPIDIRPDRLDNFSHELTIPADTFGADPVRPSSRIRGSGIFEPAASADQTRRLDAVLIESSGAGIERAGIPATATRAATITRTIVWCDYNRTPYNPPRYRYAITGAIGAAAAGSSYPTSASAALSDDGASITLGWSSSRHWLGDTLFTADRVTASSRPCHTADPAAAPDAWCKICGNSLARAGLDRRPIRTRYRWLSSFDYNEPAPLYFLAALPRLSRAATVASAVDDLAPAAVHAAYARGLAVERQGDIFLIPTALSTADLETRGADRARLTMHTRGAMPKIGEIGYRAPLDANGRRRMHRWQVAEFRRIVRDDANRRATGDYKHAQPFGTRGARARFAKLRADHAADIERGNAAMRAAIFGSASSRGYGSRPYGMGAVRGNRALVANAVRQARATLDRLAIPRTDAHGYRTARAARDLYRTTSGRVALDAWTLANHRARVKFEPQTMAVSNHRQKHARKVAVALAIYGTAHTASEVAVTRVGTYARGTVRHVPALAGDSWREPDHRPIQLATDVWYLAIRNAVPRMRGSAADSRRFR